LFPLYRVIPAPELLLVVKSIAVGAAAYPLYLLTRRLTGNIPTGAIMGLIYLLSPSIHGANWFDFQPRSCSPTTHTYSGTRETTSPQPRW
ncbi:TPA: DUF2079 domain-containing protein, partial [Candidatus Bathyarchaeota archaeon]|nr:DUF2079 domain-containing protein [Candidatus Bathyarchaeota archaeon]